MKVGITGITGRMGQAIVLEVLTNSNMLDIGSVLVRHGSDLVNKDLGEFLNRGHMNVNITDDIETLFEQNDAVVDFTSPVLTLACARVAAKKHKIFISGTTGLNDTQLDELREYGKETTIVWSSNMSLGVNVLLNLVEETATLLRDDFDIEILDIHHRTKRDAPSGTALALGKAAARGRGWEPNEVFKMYRSGPESGNKGHEIGFASLRCGDIAGEHQVIFAGPNESLELVHKTGSRIIFVKGAIRALFWAYGKPNGFYSMQDVLKIDK